jgi:predicted nucleic acid-binding protein
MSEPLRIITEALVVDASVAFKWFFEDREDDVDAARDLLEAHRDAEIALCAPELLYLEVASALRKRGVDVSVMAAASELLGEMMIGWAPIDADLASTTGRLAAEHEISVYDAAYAALARHLDAELVTADRRLAASGACRTRLLGTPRPKRRRSPPS